MVPLERLWERSVVPLERLREEAVRENRDELLISRDEMARPGEESGSRSRRSYARVIPPSGVYLQALSVLLGDDGNGAILAVGFETGGPVGDEVAAANLITQFVERPAKRHDVARKHGFSAAALSESLEDLVGFGLVATTFFGADGVNSHTGGFFVTNGLSKTGVAGVIFAVGNDNQDSRYTLVLRIGCKLPAGIRHSIEERCSTVVG